MANIKDIKTSLSKTGIYLDQLDSTIEERDRLVNVLSLTPSSNDNYDLINLLTKILKYLSYLQEDLIETSVKGESKSEVVAQFRGLVSRYEDLNRKLNEDPDINIDEFRFESKEIPKVREHTKSVRFEDDLVKDNEEMMNELMGTRAFKSYKDDPDVESFDTETNQQIYAQHQQTLLSQDEDLDVLHQSITKQHSMGIHINQELDEHLIILDDLEQGVDNAQLRLNSATNRLVDFRRKCKENGSLVTIVVLTVILIVLLVVLN